YHHFGEGEYERTERVIQQLLGEAGVAGIGPDLASVDARGPEVAADWSDLKSGENYVGYQKTENFASPGGAAHDKPRAYTAPGELRLNQWALAGEWIVGGETAVADKAGGRIIYRFHARDVNLVMGPAAAGKPVRFRVRIDGQPPEAAHGAD